MTIIRSVWPRNMVPVRRHRPHLGMRSGLSPRVLVLALVAAAVCAVLTPLTVFGSTPSDQGTVLVSMPWGQGAGELGLAKTDEGLTRGPEALAVSPDGRVAILDSVNHRVVLLDAQGKWTGSIPVELAEPRFLAVDDSSLYVLDCDADQLMATYTWSGESLGTVSAWSSDQVVTALFATSLGACIEVGHDKCWLMNAKGGSGKAAAASVQVRGRELQGRPLDKDMKKAAHVSYARGEGARVRSGSVDKSNLRVSIDADSSPSLAGGESIEHLVSVDGDGRGGMVVGARLMQPRTKDGVDCSLAITRIAPPSSAKPGAVGLATHTVDDRVLLIAESHFAYVGQPYVVAPDGRIFQPLASESGYAILVHSFEEDES